MTNFDDELRNALRRQQPSTGFAERVVKRAKQNAEASSASSLQSWLRLFRRPVMRWAAAGALAAMLMAGVGEGIHYRNMRRERAAGEAAKQRLMLALRIAGSKLQLARSRVNRANTADRNENQVHSDQREN
jgi:hypothetical protein